ncbi:ATP-binding protein, partial [Clostridium sp.]
GMEYMDGDGEIDIKAYSENNEAIIEVRDNGPGMTEDIVESLLKKVHASKKGSGVGIRNVNERIKLYFGSIYGLEINSEPDEGTSIKIHIPIIKYDDYEKGGNKKNE